MTWLLTFVNILNVVSNLSVIAPEMLVDWFVTIALVTLLLGGVSIVTIAALVSRHARALTPRRRFDEHSG
jgi:hypothetical protein